jgi:ATP-dependent helicase Lhr and Lhr-like helicase
MNNGHGRPNAKESSVLDAFHPVVRRWFEATYGDPTPPQKRGWPSIAAGNNTLILAPTGSGKTLAAFLWAINHLVEQRLTDDARRGVRILYVSPLKALNNDIHRNLEQPLESIAAAAVEAGTPFPPITSAVRTGDTPSSRRASMIRNPPDILITTPESLYLMLTSARSRPMFETVQYVIVDEIHSVCGNKRGVHLSITLERLQEVARQELVRIGLSATQRPLERVAEYLAGYEGGKRRPVTIIDAGGKKEMDLRVECAVPDMGRMTGDSAWNDVFLHLLELIQAHRSTLLFVNNRRLAERVAATLNRMLAEGSQAEREGDRDEGIGPINLYAVPRQVPVPAADIPTVQAYHGSMSREARETMEEDLKAGRTRALVATSALELGIDIGSIDLVIQIQSPKSIARGLQRVGRSGHLISATSKGRIFPTYREDLVEAAVVAKAMEDHRIEETRIPRNCLDILAQQIVAMVSVEERDVEGLYEFMRRSACYRDLPRAHFDGVIAMLAGRYEREDLRGLSATVSWDRINNVLRALPGSAKLAIMGGGAITDKGAFGVYLADGTTKVGEVDEEFVYETRTGDTFLLGTQVWRVEGIDPQRLTVSPAPGEAARMPFWRGEGLGRSYELGADVGAFRRKMAVAIDRPDVMAELIREYPIDHRSAWNLVEYFRRQRESTKSVPNDGLLLLEGFRDEIGDPRLVLHSSYGRRVNTLLGLILSKRIHNRMGAEPQVLSNDNAVLVRCPDVEELPLDLLDGLTVEEARSCILDEVLSSPLFGGLFRQNAARALMMPRAFPGKRTPLWLQRLRAKDLLQVARRYDDFPIVMETIRETLEDALDFEHCLELVAKLASGEIRTASVTTETPSPFAAGVLFDFIAVYMYEWDQPRADTSGQFMGLNRELLNELVDQSAAANTLRSDAVAEVESRLQHTADGTRARSPEELMEILLQLGDLSAEEIRMRCQGDATSFIERLASDGRAASIPLGPEQHWIAGEERGLFASLSTPETVRVLFLRHATTHGPVRISAFARRYGIPEEGVARIAGVLEKEGKIIRGRFTGGISEDEYSARDVLRHIHRRSVAILRHEISPCTLAEFHRFLQGWQGIGSSGHTIADTLTQLQGYPIHPELWLREIMRLRHPGQAPELSGNRNGGAWIGTPAGRMMFVERGNGNCLLSPLGQIDEDRLGSPASRILLWLRGNGASFLADLREGTGLSLHALNRGIAELFWNGWITNDEFAEILGVQNLPRSEDDQPIEPVQMIARPGSRERLRLTRKVRAAIRNAPGWNGRWALTRTPPLMGEAAGPEERAIRQAHILLQRYGVVTRDVVARESLLPWRELAPVFHLLEFRGEIRRGYFVEGLSGIQYAHPDAMEMLRSTRATPPRATDIVLLNALDPAAPFAPIATPTDESDSPLRISRHPGNYIALAGGLPFVAFTSNGARITTMGAPSGELVGAALARFVELLRLPPHIRPFREIVVEYCDDNRAADSPLAGALRSLGFVGDRNQAMRRDPYG